MEGHVEMGVLSPRDKITDSYLMEIRKLWLAYPLACPESVDTLSLKERCLRQDAPVQRT